MIRPMISTGYVVARADSPFPTAATTRAASSTVRRSQRAVTVASNGAPTA